MANHVSLSASARTLAAIDDLSEDQARLLFRAKRFAATGGEPTCPYCDHCSAVYEYRSRTIFKCKQCQRQFSLTTGTPFARRKLEFKKILKAIAAFSGPAKGFNAIDLSHRINVQHKTAYRMLRKFRDGILNIEPFIILEGEVEIDGAEIGGHIRPKNVKKSATDYRRWPNRHNEKKKIIVVVRERRGRILTTIVKREADAVPFVRARVKAKTRLYSDHGAGWSAALTAKFDRKRINHSNEYWSPEANTNSAESFFAIVRRSAFGIYHNISGPHLFQYAAEIAWRQQHNRKVPGDRFDILLGRLAYLTGPPRAPKAFNDVGSVHA